MDKNFATINIRPLEGKQTWLLALWLVPLVYILLVGKVLLIVSTAGLITTGFLFLFGLVAAWVLRQRGLQTLVTPLDAGLLAVLLALLLSAAISFDPSRSWRMVWNWTAPMLAFYIAVVIFRGGGTVRTFLKALLFALSVFIFFGYREFILWSLRWYEAFELSLLPNDLPRISGFTGSPNLLAVLMNFGILLALAYRTPEGKRPLPAKLWIIAAVPVLVLTGSRSALLGLVISGGGLYLCHLWRQSNGRLAWHAWARLVGGVVLAGVGVLLVIALIRPETLFLRANSGILYRNNFWQIALDAWQQRPWLGNGLDTYGSFYMQQTPNVPPKFPFRAAHNWWFSLLAETGLAGIGATLLCWLLLVRFLWRYRRPSNWSPLPSGLLAALMAFAVHACFDTPEPWILMLGALFLAALVVVLEKTVPAQRLSPASLKAALPLIWVPIWVVLIATSLLHWRASQQFEAGIAAAEAGEWQTAATSFDAAQSQIWYPEASFYLGSGLAHGILAYADDSHLPAAIEAYEHLIGLEPGWATNYANLAALYWQAGEHARALHTLRRAIEIAPQVPLYHLNLGLWYEASGDVPAAQQTYATLYTLETTWREAPFWQNHPPQTTQLLDEESRQAGWEALETADLATAERYFSQQINQSPYSGQAYLGLGIVHLQTDNPTAAALAFKRAALLGDGGLSSLWIPFLPAEADAGQVRANKPNPALQRLRQHTSFGLTRSNVYIYPLTVMNRLSLSYDLLPQLRCFSFSSSVDQHLRIMQIWQTAEGANANAVQLADLRRGNGDALTACSQIFP